MSAKTSGPVVLAIAGGGTGGHLFPGMAVAELALSTGFAREVIFFGAERGIESRLVPKAGYELVAQPLRGLRGGGPLGAISAIARLVASVLKARGELRRRNVEALIGLGGYASSAGVIAARLARIPVILLEQNRDPGMSNRLLARVAAAVCTSFEQTADQLPPGKAHWTGNPVRPDFEAEHGDVERDTLLVFGGSAGAVTINQAVTGALAELAGKVDVGRIVHQTGGRGLDDVDAAYRELRSTDSGIRAEATAFIDEMGPTYRRAKLAVCRAGATSVAELIATGTPAILIPYPHATGDHQTANARAVADAGAAVLVPDGAETQSRLVEVLNQLLRNSGELDSMARCAESLRRPGAAARVLEVVAGALEHRS